ncbi:hypothetical protein M514_12553, partial [Trichuris suis]|uniref:Uncharacterized protein n=1 Tax=Trichuris suis TaxID=68888 RepID=A0A085LNM8_9BILA
MPSVKIRQDESIAGNKTWHSRRQRIKGTAAKGIAAKQMGCIKWDKLTVASEGQKTNGNEQASKRDELGMLDEWPQINDNEPMEMDQKR